MLTLLFQILLLFSYPSTAQQDRLAEDQLAPTPVEVTDVLFPTTGPSVAIVSLVATVEPDGHVSATQLVDSNGSTPDGTRYQGTLVGYVEDSMTAARQWRFSPALDSSLKPARSFASIIFFYDRVFGTGTLPAISAIFPESGNHLDYFERMHTILHYLPALPTRVRRVDYLNSFFPSRNGIEIRNRIETVVLKLHVDANGSVSDADVIKSARGTYSRDRSLDEPSIRASKDWKFQPARYKGKPLRSTATVAFVFLCDGVRTLSCPQSHGTP